MNIGDLVRMANPPEGFERLRHVTGSIVQIYRDGSFKAEFYDSNGKTVRLKLTPEQAPKFKHS